MANINKIKQEILSAVSHVDRNMLAVIQEEIDILEITYGINERNNLEDFYNKWNSHRGEPPGDANKINSWLALCLGMTSVKPNGNFLPERRASARDGYPDIDSDFDYFKRQDIYDFIIKKYGREYVGNIGTNNTLKLKSTVRRIGKALDIAGAFFKGPKENIIQNEAKVKEIVSSLPKQRGAFLKIKDEEGEEHVIKTVEDAYKYCADFHSYIDQYPGIRQYAKIIEGLVSNASRHAAGICISNVPLAEIAPVRNTPKGLGTQFTYEDLESIGLIKFDILAISTLTVIHETIKEIKKNYNICVDIKNLPMNDEKTFILYRSGKLTGVFQCENGGMQETIQQIATDSISDIMVAISLYRPGPMGSIPEYAMRKSGLQKIDYFHPSIEKYVKPYLSSTYGVLCYQEQILQICNVLAGLSIVDGYSLIKGVSKKKDYIIQKYKNIFIDGCKSHDVPENIAIDYWNKFITPFAAYGFNKSHAASYACLSYPSAYLKANYPDEFFVSYLNVENIRKNHDKIIDLQRDLKNFNIVLLPKKINSCGSKYMIFRKRDSAKGINNTEIMPSLMCKGIGEDSVKEIIEQRNKSPFTNLRDIAFRTESNIVTKDVIGCLVDDGFYDEEYRDYVKKCGKVKTSKEKFRSLVVEKFVALREDFKKAGKKGIGPESLFDE